MDEGDKVKYKIVLIILSLLIYGCSLKNTINVNQTKSPLSVMKFIDHYNIENFDSCIEQFEDPFIDEKGDVYLIEKQRLLNEISYLRVKLGKIMNPIPYTDIDLADKSIGVRFGEQEHWEEIEVEKGQANAYKVDFENLGVGWIMFFSGKINKEISIEKITNDNKIISYSLGFLGGDSKVKADELINDINNIKLKY